MSLSPNADALFSALHAESQEQARRRNVGYAILHESRVGGVEAVAPAVEEIRAAGHKISVSAGERDRVIQLDDVRVCV